MNGNFEKKTKREKNILSDIATLPSTFVDA